MRMHSTATGKAWHTLLILDPPRSLRWLVTELAIISYRHFQFPTNFYFVSLGEVLRVNFG